MTPATSLPTALPARVFYDLNEINQPSQPQTAERAHAPAVWSDDLRTSRFAENRFRFVFSGMERSRGSLFCDVRFGSEADVIIFAYTGRRSVHSTHHIFRCLGPQEICRFFLLRRRTYQRENRLARIELRYHLEWPPRRTCRS
jgi:hypothetical protein